MLERCEAERDDFAAQRRNYLKRETAHNLQKNTDRAIAIAEAHGGVSE